MIPDIAGIIISWFAGRGYFKKGSKEMLNMEKRLKEENQKLLEKAIEVLKKSYEES